MKKIGHIILALILVACGPNSFTTENGTVVTYHTQGDGGLAVDSLVSMLRIKYTTEEGELMMDVDEPMPLKIDPNSGLDQGELFNVLTQLKVGDSVSFELLAEELFSKTFKAPLPDTIAPASKIQFQIAYKDQLTEQGYYDMVAKRAEEASAKQIIVDSEILDSYLAENNIEAQKTESGLRYVITDEGTGNFAKNGDAVSVDYIGRVLNGEYFDTSNEALAKENGIYSEQRAAQIGYNPYELVIGQGSVIKGWDEGLLLIPIGGKGTLYIPSTLGYGSRGSGPVIPPNSILVFDVELVEK